MFGQATITIPKCGPIPASTHDGLSDAVAMDYGKRFAKTLSEPDGFVVVTLECGEDRIIGYDTTNGDITIGRLINGLQYYPICTISDDRS
jgi:hypothetical protein